MVNFLNYFKYCTYNLLLTEYKCCKLRYVYNTYKIYLFLTFNINIEIIFSSKMYKM